MGEVQKCMRSVRKRRDRTGLKKLVEGDLQASSQSVVTVDMKTRE